MIEIAGKVDVKQTDFILKRLESHVFKSDSDTGISLPPYKTTNLRVFSYKKDTVQSSIRMGRVLPKRNHPDMPGLVVLNSVLGGYFGSRLMRNLREEKGYTYGISSFIVPMAELSVWIISTEVGVGYAESTVDEIFKEMSRLKKEPLSTMSWNLSGVHHRQILRTFDGPFAIAESRQAFSV